MAGSAAWLANPGTGDWNTAGNWTPATVPNASIDIATFGLSSVTQLSLSANTEINSLVFDAGASAFTTTIEPGLGLTFSGLGITNNSGVTQNFVSKVDGSGSFGALLFTNGASAGTDTAFTNQGSAVSFGFTGYTEFFNTSSAGSGTFTNNGGTGASTFGGFTDFFDTASAGSATLIANGGTSGGGGGMILFTQSSTGGTAVVQVFDNGFLDISGHSVVAVSVGSLEGTGNVFLGARSLAVGSNGVATTFSGVIQNGGLFGGVGGSFIKTGAGKLTLSGSNTYSGVTRLQAGILALGSSGALGTSNLTFEGGTLQFSASNTVDYSAKIVNSTSDIKLDTNGQDISFANEMDSSNTGGLTKLGTGVLTLSSFNTYAGNTSVKFGSLIVNSFIFSDTTVDDGALLGGGGMIFGSVFNNGTVSPGNSPGVLTIIGDYTQSGTGILLTELASNVSYDQLIVGGGSGLATIAGTLQIVNSGYTVAAGDSFNILNSVALSGTFGTVINPYAQAPGSLLYLSVRYTATDVFLDATQNTFGNALGLFELTPNQTATAEAMDSSLNSPAQAAALTYLNGLPIGSIPRQLDLIAPEELTAIYSIGFALMDSQVLSLEQRFTDIRYAAQNALVGQLADDRDNRYGSFVTATGDFSAVKGDSNASGYDIKNGGVLSGVDYRWTRHFTSGLSFGFNRSIADLVDGGRVAVDSGRAALYGIYHTGGFYAQGLFGGGYNSYDTRRAALNGIAEGSTSGRELDAAITFGYNRRMGALTVTPIASLLYTFISINDYDETGSLLPLHIKGQSASSLRSRLGLRAAYSLPLGRVTVTPLFSAQWQHEMLNNNRSIVSRFANGSGNDFTIAGPRIGRDSALLTASVNVAWSQYALYFAYQANLNSSYEIQSVLAGFRVAW